MLQVEGVVAVKVTIQSGSHLREHIYLEVISFGESKVTTK